MCLGRSAEEIFALIHPEEGSPTISLIFSIFRAGKLCGRHANLVMICSNGRLY